MIHPAHFLVSDITAFLEDRLVPDHLDSFPLERIADIAAWSGQPSRGVHAHMLVALHGVNRSQAFSDACAEAIASTDMWRDLLTALLNNAQTGPHVIATASKVLHRRVPGHPLAGLRDTSLRVVRICDALDDGTRLRVTRSTWSGLGEGRCWLLGLTDPVDQFADAAATDDGDNIVIDPGQADWLERSRLACPAFIAIAA